MFNLDNKSFFKRSKGKNIPLDDDNWGTINTKFLLDVPNFDEIINVNSKLQMLSTRKVKERDEDKEDLNSKKKAKKYIKNEVNRVAKFEYNGTFSDVTKLNTSYFAYLYDKDNDTYFFIN